MKNFFLFIALCALISCTAKSTQIAVENPLDFNRNGEMVEVSLTGLNVDFVHRTYVLKDEKGGEVGYQLLSDKQTLIFQANVPAKSTVVYSLEEGKPAPVAARAHVRFVPERSDDMSWENDIAAYRMYGPALMKIEHPSNGVDIWMKYKDEPVMDNIYEGSLKQKLSYHEDCGLGGLDCYDVGHTLGAGGSAPYTSKLWIGDAFARYGINENGPLRAVFTLYYDTIPVEGGYYTEKITITSDAGSPLNKAVVSFDGAKIPMQLATGICMTGDSVSSSYDKVNRIITYTKNNIISNEVSQGQTYLGVYSPQATGDLFPGNKHHVLLNDYKVGEELTYYFGGGWSKWKFPTEEDWITTLVHFSQAKQTPLVVSVNQIIKSSNH